jgi:uncharacterized membrane protein YkoI
MRAYPRTIFIIISTLLGVVGVCHVSLADDYDRHRRDHDLARQALERGDLMPLEFVLAAVHKSVSGEVAGVELEHEHGTWLYEIAMILPGGMLTEVKVDARTGRIIGIKGR